MEPQHRGVYPAVQGNKFGCLGRSPSFRLEGTNVSATQFRVVVSTVDLAADRPSQSGSDHHIGGKMLPRGYAARADGAGKTIGSDLRQHTGILVRAYRGRRPCEDGMVRGE